MLLLLSLNVAFAVSPPPPVRRPQDTWDTTALYPTVEAWEAEVGALTAAIPGLASCDGKLAAELKPCLDQLFDLDKRAARVYVYAQTNSDVDTRDDVWMGRSQRAGLLSTQLDEASSFFGPQVLALGAPAVEAAIAKDPGLKPYDHYLRSVVRQAPHTLDAQGEALLAATGTIRGAPNQIHTVLVAGEIPWPTVKLSDGSEQTVDLTSFTVLRQLPDPGDRKAVFEAFFGRLGDYSGTAGALLDASTQGHWFEARARKYPTCVAAAMAGDNLPPAIYETLVARTNANLPTLHRYLALRKKLLGLPELSYYDLYPSLVNLDRTWTIEQAEALVVLATAPLGPTYTDGLQEGFGARWMDVYPGPGKAGGAYMEGAAYDVHPFVLMNYADDYYSVSTLAHEWGHAMHSVSSSRSQPYPKADYATFIAEIASTFNEALLLDTMLKTAKSDEEKLYYLGMALEGLRTTYFRQAQFAEFELAMHARVEAGEPLTGDWLSATYLDIVRRYYGADQGVTRVDDPVGYEWEFISHFYYDFYVYQYATSIAASSLLADEVMAKKKGALDRYLTLLAAGGSDDPYVLLKAAGVDMATAAPYDAIAGRMNRIMDQMEAILAKQEKARKKAK